MRKIRDKYFLIFESDWVKKKKIKSKKLNKKPTNLRKVLYTISSNNIIYKPFTNWTLEIFSHIYSFIYGHVVQIKKLHENNLQKIKISENWNKLLSDTYLFP